MEFHKLGRNKEANRILSLQTLGIRGDRGKGKWYGVVAEWGAGYEESCESLN